MTKFKNSNSDKTKKNQIVTKLKNQIVTVLIVTVVTVAVVTAVIVTFFRRRKKLDTSTTDEMFLVQLFAILAMFLFNLGTSPSLRFFSALEPPWLVVV